MTADPPDTRASLLVRLKNGDDQQAWQDFVEIYEPLVLRIATRKGLQPADACDLAQEVMTRTAARIGEWKSGEGHGTLRGWLSTVTRNLVVDFIRQQNRRPTPLSDSLLQQQPGPQDEPEALFSAEERQQIFRWAAARARSQVTDSTWQAFWLTAVEHQPPAGVAVQLGITVGAVYIARSRMMARIRQEAALALDHSTEWKQLPAGDWS
jgi:RNA polymerase sigma-70 factor (ECF subfamily)